MVRRSLRRTLGGVALCPSGLVDVEEVEYGSVRERAPVHGKVPEPPYDRRAFADERSRRHGTRRLRTNAAAAERTAWDGAWYRRAFYDDGTPLGSAAADECRIDAIAQSWAVLSGAANPERARVAMRSVGEQLIDDDIGLLLLLAPPFDQSRRDPGYIKGYLPGIRENGAQYTHAALWTVLATARLGDGDRAAVLMRMLNPLSRTGTPDGVCRYAIEPYVIAGDVYAAPGHEGRGGWSWYTGAASWSYRVALEAILGFDKRGDQLRLDPCIPAAWPGFELDYRFGRSVYAISVTNCRSTSRGVVAMTVDGAAATSGWISLVDDGARHVVAIVLGAAEPSS